MTNEQRLRQLFEACSLALDSINSAEIKAYCVGIDYISRIFDRQKATMPSGKLFYPPSLSAIEDAFSGCEYTKTDNSICFNVYDIDSIGQLCENWIRFNMTISLANGAKTWGQIATENKEWYALNKRRLRWSMIRSVQNG